MHSLVTAFGDHIINGLALTRSDVYIVSRCYLLQIAFLNNKTTAQQNKTAKLIRTVSMLVYSNYVHSIAYKLTLDITAATISVDISLHYLCKGNKFTEMSVR